MGFFFFAGFFFRSLYLNTRWTHQKCTHAHACMRCVAPQNERKKKRIAWKTHWSRTMPERSFFFVRTFVIRLLWMLNLADHCYCVLLLCVFFSFFEVVWMHQWKRRPENWLLCAARLQFRLTWWKQLQIDNLSKAPSTHTNGSSTNERSILVLHTKSKLREQKRENDILKNSIWFFLSIRNKVVKIAFQVGDKCQTFTQRYFYSYVPPIYYTSLCEIITYRWWKGEWQKKNTFLF